MPAAAQQAVELSIGGMTCASCAARIEKKLNKLDRVTATVNFATEKAAVSFPGTVTPDNLIAVVEQTGYTAALPAPPPQPEVDGAPEAGAQAAAPSARGDDEPGAAANVMIPA
jgi:P-type Cu+ transporter